MKKTVITIILVVTFFAVTFGQEKRYGIESAIVKKNTVMKMQGMPTEQTISTTQYFADYGNKESAEASMNVAGQTFNTFTMIKEGYVYSANLSVKQGSKVNLAAMDDYSTVNFLELTDEVKKKYQIQANGVQQIIGKDCNRYEMSFTTQGQTVNATVWVWQGLTLKSSVKMGGTSVEEEVTEIQEGAAIAAEKFVLPEGITFTEIKPQM